MVFERNFIKVTCTIDSLHPFVHYTRKTNTIDGYSSGAQFKDLSTLTVTLIFHNFQKCRFLYNMLQNTHASTPSVAISVLKLTRLPLIGQKAEAYVTNRLRPNQFAYLYYDLKVTYSLLIKKQDVHILTVWCSIKCLVLRH